MATFTTFMILALLLGILQLVSARPAEPTPTPPPPPELCTPLWHPDLPCGSTFDCEKNWPSETGNYGSSTLKLRARDTPLRTISPTEGGMNFTATGDANYHRRSRKLWVPGAPGLQIEPQCCRPTVECYNFMADEVKMDGIDWNGRLIIKDVNDWKKAECCMADFQQSKSWCLFPPARNRWIVWNEPPDCADVH